MARFLFCSFALVLLYPSGIDMYLVGLPHIARDLGASEAQLHIAFSAYLAGMASSMVFAGKIADKAGRQPVAIAGAIVFALASLLCSQAQNSTVFLTGRFIQGIGAGGCYVVAFAILRDTLSAQRRAKVLSMLNGITCIIPVLAPVVGYLIMLKFPWQSLFWTMAAMGALVFVLSIAVLKETHPGSQNTGHTATIHPAEKLLNRFFLSRLTVTTLSVAVILTYVNVSPVLLMETMGFDRGEYSTVMALTAMVSMAVSFSTPFALNIFRQRTLMLTSQVLFLAAGAILATASSHAVMLVGITLICAGFSVGFGVAMSQALGPFSLRAGVASSVLRIAQVCGSSLWIWLAAVIGLNALNMLIGVLIGCSVTKAAKRMNVTPSAVSKSLAKLRDWFDDPLFVKTPLGLLPTPLTVSLEQDLADWMQIGNQILDKFHHDSPGGLTFVLAAETPLMLIRFNTLLEQVNQRYPQATVKMRQWDYDSLDAITRGEVDLGFTGRETHPRSRELLKLMPWFIDYEILFSDRPCVYLREDHPALQQEWNLETFLRYPHISIFWERSDTWALDEVLKEMGRDRTIAMSLPGFEQAMFMAAQPGHHYIATAPHYCHHYNELHQRKLIALPIPIDEEQADKLTVPFTLIWHKRNSHNPKILWLRETIKALYGASDPIFA